MIGGDLSVTTARLISLGHKTTQSVVQNDDSKHISLFSAFIVLLCTSFIFEPFTLPYGFRCGCVQAVLVTIVVGAASYFCFNYFFSSWRFGEFSTTKIWATTFSKKTVWIPRLISVISFLCECTYHSLLIVTEFQSIASMISSTVPTAVSSGFFSAYIINAIVGIIAIFGSRIASFTIVSYCSTFLRLISFLILFVLMILCISEFGFDPNHQIVYFGGSWSSLYHLLIQLLYFFFFHPIAYPVIVSMDRPTSSRISRLISWVVIAMAVFVIITGLFGYFVGFNNITSDSIFSIFPKKYIIPSIIGRICSYIAYLASYVNILYLTASEIADFVIPGSSESRTARIIPIICVVLLVAAYAFCGQITTRITIVIGVLARFLLAYAFPLCFYFQNRKFSEPLFSALVIVLTVFALGANIFIIYLGILNILQDFPK